MYAAPPAPRGRRTPPPPRGRPAPAPARALPQPVRHRYYALWKPYGVLTRFDDPEGRPTLRPLIPTGVYPVGRLDADSEGLLLLTDDPAFQAAVTRPGSRHGKTYLVQVEREPAPEALASLQEGLLLGDGPTLPAEVRPIPEPDLPERPVPIRFRKNVPTSWLELVLFEGRNRQVRRMTAAVGHPTLRLVRWAVGPVTLAGMSPGECREFHPDELAWARHAASEARISRRRSADERGAPAHHRELEHPRPEEGRGSAPRGRQPEGGRRGERSRRSGPERGRAEGPGRPRPEGPGRGRPEGPGRPRGKGRGRRPKR